jgi:hypothetical protein
MHAIGTLPGVRNLEGWIRGLPPTGAAVFFVLPSALILPVKIIALHAILHGHVLRGTLVVIGAKLLATALFARIYVLTQPALMRVHWFVAVHRVVLRWRAWTYAQIEDHPLWRAMRRTLARWRAGREAHPGRWTRRWRALGRLDRRRRGNGTTSPPRPTGTPPES